MVVALLIAVGLSIVVVGGFVVAVWMRDWDDLDPYWDDDDV